MEDILTYSNYVHVNRRNAYASCVIPLLTRRSWNLVGNLSFDCQIVKSGNNRSRDVRIRSPMDRQTDADRMIELKRIPSAT